MKDILFVLYFSLFFCLCNYSASASIDSLDIDAYIQKHQLDVKKDDNGIAYFINKKAKGDQAKKGDYVKVHYAAKRLDGFTFDQSKEKLGFVFQVGYRQVIPGLDQGISLLKEGESGTLLIPANLAYGKQGVGESIPPNTDVMYEITLENILNDQEYDEYIVKLEQQERKAYETHIKQQFITDKKLIQEYALANKLRTKRTTSGLSYIITKEGKGDLAIPGDILDVAYEGRLIDDTVFDASQKDKMYTFKLGVGKVIQGWDEGLSYFNEGSEGYILIPSKMAYGPRSIKEEGINIPADAVLIFKISVQKIHKAQKFIPAK